MSLNVCTIMGRLTRDVELRRTPSGVAVANFTLAVDRDYNPKDGGEKETDFIDCVAWRKTAEVIQKYVHSGDQIFIEGEIKYRSWENDKGEKRYSTDIVADRVELLGSKGNSQVDDVPD